MSRCWPTGSGSWETITPPRSSPGTTLRVPTAKRATTRRAVALHEQALAGEERLLGDEHPTTLTVRGDLAAAYQELRGCAASDPAV